MTEMTDTERSAAIDLARRALAAAERNRADENPNAGELAAIAANNEKQARNRALLGIHPTDTGAENDDG